jgi:hypothetical protein
MLKGGIIIESVESGCLLLTNCSNTLRKININARENITMTRAKRKAGYFFVVHPVYDGIDKVSHKTMSF